MRHNSHAIIFRAAVLEEYNRGNSGTDPSYARIVTDLHVVVSEAVPHVGH